MVAAVVVLAKLGHADAPAGRYAFPSAGVVVDTETGLTWQHATAPAASDWAQAGSYCQSLALDATGSGWRLPSMKELQTIVDISRQIPAADPTAFPEAMSAQYWTSSPVAGLPSEAWVVDFRNGAARTIGQDTLNWIRCVR